MMLLIEVDDPADVGKNEKWRMLVYSCNRVNSTDTRPDPPYIIRATRVHEATPESIENKI